MTDKYQLPRGAVTVQEIAESIDEGTRRKEPPFGTPLPAKHKIKLPGGGFYYSAMKITPYKFVSRRGRKLGATRRRGESIEYDDISAVINEVHPPGFSGVVAKLKRKFKGDHSKPFMIAWSQYKRGMKPYHPPLAGDKYVAPLAYYKKRGLTSVPHPVRAAQSKPKKK